MNARIRSIGVSAALLSLFSGVIYAQSFSSPYVECVAPAVRVHADQSLQLQISYDQQLEQLLRQRGDARVNAWRNPERSTRSRALRDADSAYRDAVRDLNRALKDQKRTIDRQFKDAEDVCDDQFDADVDDPNENSSSSFSSRSSSFSSNWAVCGNRICEPGEAMYCPPCDTFGCTNSCAVGTCPQDCPNFSTSSSSSRSSSSFVACFSGDVCVPVGTCNAIGGTFVSPGACGNQSQMQAGYYCCRQKTSSSSSSLVFYPNEDGRAQIQSCSCETVCDPSGSPCMAVCPTEC